MNKKVLIVGLVAVGLIFAIGSVAAIRPTIYIGGDVPDGVVIQGRNLPEVILGIGPQEEVRIGGQTITATRPTIHLGIGSQEEVIITGRNLPGVTLGMGPQEEVRIGGQVITEDELAEKIAVLWGGQ